MPKNLHLSFKALTHLTQGLHLSTLLTLEVWNSASKDKCVNILLINISYLLKSVTVRLLKKIEAHASFHLAKAIYKTTKLSTEEKLYVIKLISLSPWNTHNQRDNENANYY